jgi:hypothetical protein
VNDQDQANYGFLHRVKGKTHPKGPDMTGAIKIDGSRYELAGWVRTSKAGNKYVNLVATKVISPQTEQAAPPHGKDPAATDFPRQ